MRGLRDLLWAADCTSKSLAAIAQTRHDTSDGAGGGWGCPDTGREFRHGKKRAQTRIPNCKRRCDACGEIPGSSAIVPRHGLIRISNANSPICPAHPPHLPLPLIVVRCCMASDGAAQKVRHPPHHPPPLSTHGALLHGIGTDLLTGTATHPTTTWHCGSATLPTTNNLPSV